MKVEDMTNVWTKSAVRNQILSTFFKTKLFQKALNPKLDI